MFNKGKNRPNLVESAISPSCQSDRQTTLDQSVWIDGDVHGSTLTRTVGSKSTSTGSTLTDTKAGMAHIVDSQTTCSAIQTSYVGGSLLNGCVVVGSNVRDATLHSTLIEWSDITGWAAWEKNAVCSTTPMLPHLEGKVWWLESALIRSRKDLIWSTDEAVGGALLIYRRKPYHGVEQWGLTTPLLSAPIIGESPQEVAHTLRRRFLNHQIKDRDPGRCRSLLEQVPNTRYYNNGGEITLPGEKSET